MQKYDVLFQIIQQSSSPRLLLGRRPACGYSQYLHCLVLVLCSSLAVCVVLCREYEIRLAKYDTKTLSALL